MNGSEDNFDRGSKFEIMKYIGFIMIVKYMKF